MNRQERQRAIEALQSAGISTARARQLLSTSSSFRDEIALRIAAALLSRSFGETGWGQPSDLLSETTPGTGGPTVRTTVADRIATEAYIMADALLAARETPGDRRP